MSGLRVTSSLAPASSADRRTGHGTAITSPEHRVRSRQKDGTAEAPEVMREACPPRAPRAKAQQAGATPPAVSRPPRRRAEGPSELNQAKGWRRSGPRLRDAADGKGRAWFKGSDTRDARGVPDLLPRTPRPRVRKPIRPGDADPFRVTRRSGVLPATRGGGGGVDPGTSAGAARGGTRQGAAGFTREHGARRRRRPDLLRARRLRVIISPFSVTTVTGRSILPGPICV